MHGLVNRAIEDMVCEKFDSATWATIRAKVEVDTVAFNSMDGYPDEVTYALVGATSEVLGAPSTICWRPSASIGRSIPRKKVTAT